MKPYFSNAFGVARNTGADGKTVELQLDFMLQYMEAETQITPKGPVTASARKREQLTSVLLTPSGVATLIGMLRKALGSEFDDIVSFCEAQDEMQEQ
ncbi:MAG: hypothetical protein E7425_10235 [Ruminococcaceae bacterium]|jgi:hypothetical protein|nr:hypothetical protein [Oscillospiraceae bacterium]